jgi:hypothetical protein
MDMRRLWSTIVVLSRWWVACAHRPHEGANVQIITLADGRELTYDTYGDPNGTPVIFSHGLTDSRLIRNPDEALTRSLGVWIIAADQPGVGGSTPQPGRRMADWGPDMEQLADELGLGPFVVSSHTGVSSPTPRSARCSSAASRPDSSKTTRAPSR